MDKKKKSSQQTDKEKIEIIEDALLKNVTGGMRQDLCGDDAGDGCWHDTCYDGVCYGGGPTDPTP